MAKSFRNLQTCDPVFEFDFTTNETSVFQFLGFGTEPTPGRTTLAANYLLADGTATFTEIEIKNADMNRALVFDVSPAQTLVVRFTEPGLLDDLAAQLIGVSITATKLSKKLLNQ